MNVFLALRILYIVVMVASCLFAIKHGGRAERYGVAIVIVASFLTLVVEQPTFFDWRYARGGLLAVDVGVLIAIFTLAQRSDRFWPIWATAFHLIAVTTHLVIAWQPHLVLQAYAIAQGFWAYPVMVSMAIGAESHRRRERLSHLQIPAAMSTPRSPISDVS